MAVEFDRYAAGYDQLLSDPIRDGFAADSAFFHWRKWLLIRDFFSRHGMETRSMRWLDVGCGRGELLHLGGSTFGEAIGCDPAVEMTRSANVRAIYQPRATELPFESDGFDFLTAVCVYHHVNAQDRPLLTAEISRVLRPGGFAAIIEHNPYNPVTRLIVSRTPVDAHAQLLCAASSRNLLQRSGLQIKETRYFLYLPQRLFALAGRAESLLSLVPFGGQYAVFARRER